MKKYLLYHTKWQAGAIVAIPCMYLFLDYMQLSYWLAVFLMQFIGALVFFPIDNYIFKNKKQDHKQIIVFNIDSFLNDICKRISEQGTSEIKSEYRLLKAIMINLKAGLLPKHLQGWEINILETHYGLEWFNVLGYQETHYTRPL